MNQKKCKRIRRYATTIAGGKYDVKGVYKALKSLERNYEAAMARIRLRADKSIQLSQNVLDGKYETNT